MGNSKLQVKTHPSLLLHKDISNICDELFKEQDFCIMNFIRLNQSSNSVFYLCDNYIWLHHYLSNGYPRVGAFEQNTSLRSHEYILWDTFNENDSIVAYSREMFNIKHGITLVRKISSGYDFFNFGVDSRSIESRSEILIKIDILNRFVQEFYNKAARLISSSCRQAFALESFEYNNTQTKPAKRLYLGPQYDYNHLTPKEIFCLQQLAKGLSLPKISESTDVSLRTLEKQIQCIKKKLNCSTQFELGYIAAKLAIEKLAI